MKAPPPFIELGTWAEPLSKQLKGCMDPKTLKSLDGHAIAITRLSFHGILSVAERERARTRLLKRIRTNLNKRKPSAS